MFRYIGNKTKLLPYIMEAIEELAQILGVSFATVNRWETGKHEPTISAKRKIRDLCKKNGINL